MEVQCFEIKTEADSNDSTLCSDDVKPSTGMFAVSDSRGLVVTSGALPEPSNQLIHNRSIDEEIKLNRTQTHVLQNSTQAFNTKKLGSFSSLVVPLQIPVQFLLTNM